MGTYLSAILCVTSTICLWSAILLVVNWQGVKQRRWLAFMLLFWGIGWTRRVCGLIFGDTVITYNVVLPPEPIIAGMFASFTFLIWPIALLKKRAFNRKEIILFLLPFFACIIVYYGAIKIFGLHQFVFTSLGEVWRHITYFSVWFRIIMCLCLIGYLAATIKLIFKCITGYNQYVEENYAEYEKFTIKWMPKYILGLIIIAILFFLNLFVGSIATFVAHNIVTALFMAWLSARVMVYTSPYASELADDVIPNSTTDKGQDFSAMFDVYKLQIERWLLSERPYLSSDFSLKNVMSHFCLNRTYASKIFNEGFGRTFMVVIRELRIEHAKKLIEQNPTITMADVAHLCGYSTPQAFHRAFVYCSGGQTPGEYALALKTKEPEK